MAMLTTEEQHIKQALLAGAFHLSGIDPSTVLTSRFFIDHERGELVWVSPARHVDGTVMKDLQDGLVINTHSKAVSECWEGLEDVIEYASREHGTVQAGEDEEGTERAAEGEGPTGDPAAESTAP